jgi:hypothetical protein
MASIYFLDAIAVDTNRLYAACQLDDVEPREVPHTRMCSFDAPDDHEWFSHDVEMNIVSVTKKIQHINDKDNSRRLVGLSKEGEIDIFAAGDYVWRTEKIPEAGARQGSRGHMTYITQIGANLFACGQNGQVYKRLGDDQWMAIDEGIYKAIDYASTDPATLMEAMMNQRVLNCIDGNNENDLYVVGDEGFFAHYNGSTWNNIAFKTNEHLQWVKCYGKDEIWACGYNGTLLRGSISKGFINVSTAEDNYTWWSLAKHDNKIYLSATEGLFCYFDGEICIVKTGLQPEHSDTNRVSAADGALWSIGAKDIVRLKESEWKRFHHTDNPRIGA